ncbi:hypothetical protein BJ138DRAFT_1057429 [Hygrophoropsis aurantiaca]|uniref:Uncharacterized protein n=1 Tax=Hygrophoropsis aurantiaca TaxID=72124 RepID=A0ACB8ANQ4_9AGAM|nr:hypothetical protein BJ138DRAFT_1057429 [Hygrophoropsis aurantiaca]
MSYISMSSVSESSTATTQFQFSLPFSLLSVSPALSALHASRVQRLYPIESVHLSPSNCSKCGAYLLDGGGTVNLPRVRTRRRTSTSEKECTRVYRKTCYICGASVDVPFSPTGAKLFSRVKTSSLKEKAIISHQNHGSPQSAPIFPRPENPYHNSNPLNVKKPSRPGTQSRPQKKTGLQEMLARKRETDKRSDKQKQHPHNGLAAFLNTL